MVDKFRERVDKAYSLGIKIIKDEVANHSGPIIHGFTPS
jgi:hypothetical protein